MRRLQFGEFAGRRESLIADKREDKFRTILAARHHGAKLQECEAWYICGRSFADDDIRAERLRCFLKPCSDVHGISKHGIIETLGRADVADHARARIESDAEPHRHEGFAAKPTFF